MLESTFAPVYGLSRGRRRVAACGGHLAVTSGADDHLLDVRGCAVFPVILAAAVDLPRSHVPADSVVIAEGVNVGRLWVLESGVVAVSREGVSVATIGQEGAVFGDLSALLSCPATATVRTVTACTFRVSDDPLDFLREHPELALAIATLLAKRLDALTRYLVDVREQYADRDDHLGVVDVVLESLSHQQVVDADPGSARELEAPY